MKHIYRKLLTAQVATLVAFIAGAKQAHANNFGDIAANIVDSIEELPGLLTGVAYMIGLLMGVLGVLKLKDHVENPSQTKLKDGAIGMVAGGALFALPMVYEAMSNTIGSTGNFVETPEVARIEFNLR